MVIVESINELINHPYREYIKELHIDTNEPIESIDTIIPSSVEILQLNQVRFKINDLKYLSKTSVKSLIIKQMNPDIIIEPDEIPTTIVNLSLFQYNHSLNEGTIPNSVVKLILGSFNQPLKTNDIPNSVKDLSLWSYNHQLFKDILPNSIEKLTLPSYTHPIKPNDIPNSVTKFEHKSQYGPPLLIKLIVYPIAFVYVVARDLYYKYHNMEIPIQHQWF